MAAILGECGQGDLWGVKGKKCLKNQTNFGEADTLNEG